MNMIYGNFFTPFDNLISCKGLFKLFNAAVIKFNWLQARGSHTFNISLFMSSSTRRMRNGISKKASLIYTLP